MSVVLQISDPHFGTELREVTEALAALSQHVQPGLLILSGDLTQRARPHQFQAARTFVDRLRIPWLAIPGNHDIPLFDLGARLFHPYSQHCKAFGPDLEPTHAAPDLLVVCVNTTRWYRHIDGEISSEQIERVASRLAQADRAQLRVVVVHHPVAVQRPEDRHDRLHGHATALRRWGEAGGDLVMGGHIHLPYVMALTGLARPMWAVQAGTAVSSRVREGAPNSVTLLRCGADAPAGCCLIEQWDYAARTASFARGTVSMVTPDRTTGGA